MANVLGTLFQSIADAIRSKTGGTDKMAPADFPDLISAIETGGGGSTEWVAKTGTFTLETTNEETTITHGLGVMPDFLIVSSDVVLNGSTQDDWPDDAVHLFLGWSQEVVDAIGVNEYGNNCGFYYFLYSPSSGAVISTGGQTPLSSTNRQVPVNSVNENTFRTGKYFGFHGGQPHTWIAIGRK